MKEPVTQKLPLGCGVACFAFICDISFDQAVSILSLVADLQKGINVKKLREALKSRGKSYGSYNLRLNPHKRNKIYKDGAIVFIERSMVYRGGHYLVRYKGLWMDPWINWPTEVLLSQSRSGYRKRLPGKPMYVLVPN